MEIAKGSRKRTDGPVVSGAAPDWFRQYFILERDASQIFDLNLNVVAGLLQTPDYARAILRVGRHNMDIDKLVEARMSRKLVLEREDPLQYWGVIHESAFHRVIGGRKVMAEQLNYLVEAAEADNVTLQVIPNSAGAHASINTCFLILRFNIAPQFGVVHIENLRSLFYDAPQVVQEYDDTFRRVIMSALPQKESVELIAKLRKDLYS
ncbi:DUF5753 domain-containing protein [Glycomyces tritici]|uniref:DUF5753 domain-containing protein n=1 Tax=Glycomyces tritici TaxID=2665176 RepID=A0ABT7YWI9_9ACTN|nr:DUF5753 domain-containing protein [Glycomyces tritici]MDN3243010.1 DUF5753 domain-containing protein [Glycomyces tritici]